MVSKFLKSEINFWKRGYDSGINACQTKIYIIELIQTHKKMMEFLWKQKKQLIDIERYDDEIPDLDNLDSLVESLKIRTRNIFKTYCNNCKNKKYDTG